MKCKTCKVEFTIELPEGQALQTKDADNAICPNGHSGSLYPKW